MLDATLTVNSSADTDQRDTVLTLREAMAVANGALIPIQLTQAERDQIQGNVTGPSRDTIVFSIAAGKQTINVTGGPLPVIQFPVVIDGTPPQAFPTQSIVLDGTNAGAGIDGLTIRGTNANDSLIKGLTVTKFKRHGIFIDDSGSNTIGASTADAASAAKARVIISENDGSGIRIIGSNGKSNTIINSYIGTDEAGTQKKANKEHGIEITGPDNRIGGLGEHERNVISGNDKHGIRILSGGNNKIRGNYIGTQANGTQGLANELTGIFIESGSGNQIGLEVSTDAGGVIISPANVISGNKGYGILLASTGNELRGNFIGTDKTGEVGLGNRLGGVRIEGDGNQIGGPNAGERNVISKNGDFAAGTGSGVSLVVNEKNNVIQNNNIGTGKSRALATNLGNALHGVDLSAGTLNQVNGNQIWHNKDRGIRGSQPKNKFRGNSIFNNGNNDVGLGIDIGPGGVTTDQMPVITSAVVANGISTILGTLAAAPNKNYDIEFFLSPKPDPSGYGEGRDFFFSVLVTTDSSGNATFGVGVTGSLSGWVTATATGEEPTGFTSEFSQAVQITGSGGGGGTSSVRTASLASAVLVSAGEPLPMADLKFSALATDPALVRALSDASGIGHAFGVFGQEAPPSGRGVRAPGSAGAGGKTSPGLSGGFLGEPATAEFLGLRFGGAIADGPLVRPEAPRLDVLSREEVDQFFALVLGNDCLLP